MEYDLLDLVEYWQPFGFTKSLQHILEEAELWDGAVPDKDGCIVTNSVADPEFLKVYPKDPASSLFRFLSSLFPET